MNCDTLLSVVIANYNYGRFIGDAIKSVLREFQSVPYIKMELLVVDGGSSDDSTNIIKALAGNENKFARNGNELSAWHECENFAWLSEKDGGQSNAFNKGFAKATGKFLTWLNADDIFISGAMRAFVGEVIRHPNCEWFAGSCLYADSQLNIMKCFRVHSFSHLRMRFGRISVGGPSSFFTKRIYNVAGGIDENLHFCMDTDLWWNFCRIQGLKYERITRPIFAYRIHMDSKMSGADVEMSQRNIENRRKMRCESNVLASRYHLTPKRICHVVNFLSWSPTDWIVSRWNTIRHKGKKAYEI